MTSGKTTPNRIKVFSNRAMIYLNGKYGGVALIDPEDVELIREKQPWISSMGYAVAATIRDGKKTTQNMHRVIMRAPSDTLIDHVNRNNLDNRKSNLRFADKSLNAYNSEKAPHGYYAGTSWNTRAAKWIATIRVNGKHKHLGFSDDRDRALAMRLEAEMQYFGVIRPRPEKPR